MGERAYSGTETGINAAWTSDLKSAWADREDTPVGSGETVGGTTADDFHDTRTSLLPRHLHQEDLTPLQTKIIEAAVSRSQATALDVAQASGASAQWVETVIGEYLPEHPAGVDPEPDTHPDQVRLTDFANGESPVSRNNQGTDTARDTGGRDRRKEAKQEVSEQCAELGFRATVPDQTGDAMPDGLASVEDALALGEVADPDAIATRVAAYRHEYPLLARLVGAKDAYIEAEKSTGDTQPSQTVQNLAQAHNAGHRCLFTARPDVAERVYNTIGRAPMGCRSGHSVDGERRFYTGTGDALTIDGEKMTRPGASDNVWVHDEDSGQYILRGHEGTVHARFDSVEEIFTDAAAYPDEGERKIKRPVIPDYEFEGELDDVEWDIIVVPEAPRDENVKKERLAPADLTLYRQGEPNVPLPDLLGDDEQPLSEEDMTEPLSANLEDGMQEMF